MGLEAFEGVKVFVVCLYWVSDRVRNLYAHTLRRLQSRRRVRRKKMQVWLL